MEFTDGSQDWVAFGDLSPGLQLMLEHQQDAPSSMEGRWTNRMNSQAARSLAAACIVMDCNDDPVADGIWLSLCGGMECLALIAKALELRPTWHISVEVHEPARRVAALHKRSNTHCGVDHGWKWNIWGITQEDIISTLQVMLSVMLSIIALTLTYSPLRV